MLVNLNRFFNYYVVYDFWHVYMIAVICLGLYCIKSKTGEPVHLGRLREKRKYREAFSEAVVKQR